MAAAIKLLDSMICELEILTSSANHISIENSKVSEVKTVIDASTKTTSSSSSGQTNESIYKSKDNTTANKQNIRRAAPEKNPESNEPLNINALDLRVGIITGIFSSFCRFYCFVL